MLDVLTELGVYSPAKSKASGISGGSTVSFFAALGYSGKEAVESILEWVGGMGVSPLPVLAPSHRLCQATTLRLPAGCQALTALTPCHRRPKCSGLPAPK